MPDRMPGFSLCPDDPSSPSGADSVNRARRVVVVVPDLFFATRIATTARALDVEVVACTAAEGLEVCRRDPPGLVILDLQGVGDPAGLARALKADPATRRVRIAGFYSHMDRETRRGALAAGVDDVLPRSAFTARLAELIAGSASPGGV
jgi:CheY-like chemotaxis protein